MGGDHCRESQTVHPPPEEVHLPADHHKEDHEQPSQEREYPVSGQRRGPARFEGRCREDGPESVLPDVVLCGVRAGVAGTPGHPLFELKVENIRVAVPV